jgi:hypothetical protein
VADFVVQPVAVVVDSTVAVATAADTVSSVNLRTPTGSASARPEPVSEIAGPRVK